MAERIYQTTKNNKMMKESVVKATLVILTILATYVNTAFSQSKITFSTEAQIGNCTCENTGKIKIQLTDTIGCNIDINNIRYSLYSPENLICSENSTSSLFQNLPPGHYIAVTTALCYTGDSGAAAHTLVSDTIQAYISTSYTEPRVGILENEFTPTSPFGKVRTLRCSSTGIVQLQIQGGSFPYTIEIQKLNETQYQYFRTEIFDSIQHHGMNPAKMDYYQYYSIDSFPAGKFNFTVTDGCGYSLPYVETEVLPLPDIEQTSSFFGYGENDDPNAYNSIFATVFSIENTLDYFARNAYYYALRQKKYGERYWDYRIIEPEINGLPADTNEWLPVPFDTIRYSIKKANRYCDFWGKSHVIQVRDNSCHKIKDNNISFIQPHCTFYETFKITIPELSYNYNDSCGIHRHSGTRTSYRTLQDKTEHSWHLFTSNINNQRKVTYTIRDIAADTLIEQGEAPIFHNKSSFVKEYSFDSIYDRKFIQFSVFDAFGCVLDNHSFQAEKRIEETIIDQSAVCVQIQPTNPSFCDWSAQDCQFKNLVEFGDKDTIEIFSAPMKINCFKAYYDAQSQQWIRCDSNSSVQTSGNKRDLNVKHLLGSGTLGFRYTNPCSTQQGYYTLVCDNEGNGKVFVPKNPQYQISQDCHGLQIICIAGKYDLHYYNKQNEYIVDEVEPVFKVYGNPNVPNIVTGYYHLGDTIFVSNEGSIKIIMCDPYNYTSDDILCHFRDTTITYKKEMLQYDYFYSYCCQIGDTVSSVRTRVKNGIPPYQYTIFDKHNNPLSTNETGDFFNLPLPHKDTVYLQVCDQCGNSFTYKGQVIEQQLIKKAWFDDGLKQKTVNDSSWCQFFAITIDNLNYHWNGPNEFISEQQNPLFFIPKDSNMTGIYYMSLHDSICGLIQDSLNLIVRTKENPQILIWISDSICSGTTYTNYGFNIPSNPIGNRQTINDTIVNSLGDSIFLTLTQLPVYLKNKIDSIICILDTFEYAGQSFSDSGLYEIKGLTNCGCDSIIRLHLRFLKDIPCPVAKDYDGNTYEATQINGICWTKRNLESTHYSDGREIAPIYEYHYHEHPNTEENVSVFGRLYDWYSAIDTGKIASPDVNGNIQGICPDGWALPTRDDFLSLNHFPAVQLRSNQYWIGETGTNESQFSSLPGGYFDSMMLRYSNLLGYAYYWTTSLLDSTPFVTQINFFCDKITTEKTQSTNAYSIRCVKKFWE